MSNWAGNSIELNSQIRTVRAEQSELNSQSWTVSWTVRAEQSELNSQLNSQCGRAGCVVYYTCDRVFPNTVPAVKMFTVSSLQPILLPWIFYLNHLVWQNKSTTEALGQYRQHKKYNNSIGSISTIQKYNNSIGSISTTQKYNNSIGSISTIQKYNSSIGSISTTQKYSSSIGSISTTQKYNSSIVSISTTQKYNSSIGSISITQKYNSSIGSISITLIFVLVRNNVFFLFITKSCFHLPWFPWSRLDILE